MTISKTTLFRALLLLAITAGFMSCNTDESFDYEGNMPGEWAVNSVNYTGNAVIVQTGTEINIPVEGEGYDITATMTFNEEPQTFTSSGTFSMKLTYSLLGVTQQEDLIDQALIGSGEWSVQNNNELLITSVDSTATFTIKKMTATTMTLTSDITTVETLEGGEVEFVLVGEIQMSKN